MSKRKRHNGGNIDLVVLLAYYHRYGFIALIFILVYATPINPAIILAVMLTFDGLHTIVGTKLGFRHLYCSVQNANHQKMTPSIRRYQLTRDMKKDLYITGTIFGMLGLAFFALLIFN